MLIPADADLSDLLEACQALGVEFAETHADPDDEDFADMSDEIENSVSVWLAEDAEDVPAERSAILDALLAPTAEHAPSVPKG